MLFASPATEAVLGVPAAEAVGMSIFSNVTPTDLELLREKLSAVREATAHSGKPQLLHLHCRMSKRSGGFFQARSFAKGLL